jgi:hypothetical protein
MFSFLHFFLSFWWFTLQLVGISGESVSWTEHENFIFARNFFCDRLSPLSSLLLPNPHREFTLNGREINFKFWSIGYKSLFFKQGIKNEIMEVLELYFNNFYFYFYFFFFVWCRKLKQIKFSEIYFGIVSSAEVNEFKYYIGSVGSMWWCVILLMILI